jgi:hypothetical protein
LGKALKNAIFAISGKGFAFVSRQQLIRTETKYMPYLPTEEELIVEIERQKEILKIQHGDG